MAIQHEPGLSGKDIVSAKPSESFSNDAQNARKSLNALTRSAGSPFLSPEDLKHWEIGLASIDDPKEMITLGGELSKLKSMMSAAERETRERWSGLFEGPVSIEV